MTFTTAKKIPIEVFNNTDMGIVSGNGSTFNPKRGYSAMCGDDFFHDKCIFDGLPTDFGKTVNVWTNVYAQRQQDYKYVGAFPFCGGEKSDCKGSWKYDGMIRDNCLTGKKAICVQPSKYFSYGATGAKLRIPFPHEFTPKRPPKTMKLILDSIVELEHVPEINLQGTYTYSGTDKKNNWHYVTVKHKENIETDFHSNSRLESIGVFEWKNAAGIKWTLTQDNNDYTLFHVSKNCPYYAKGYKTTRAKK